MCYTSSWENTFGGTAQDADDGLAKPFRLREFEITDLLGEYAIIPIVALSPCSEIVDSRLRFSWHAEEDLVSLWDSDADQMPMNSR